MEARRRARAAAARHALAALDPAARVRVARVLARARRLARKQLQRERAEPPAHVVRQPAGPERHERDVVAPQPRAREPEQRRGGDGAAGGAPVCVGQRAREAGEAVGGAGEVHLQMRAHRAGRRGVRDKMCVWDPLVL